MNSSPTIPLHPYRYTPIEECREPLERIPEGIFAFFEPAPYAALGAPYGDASPWMLRKGVLEALIRAQERLQAIKPGWKIKIFDAYRPNAVQAFMVEREFVTQVQKAGLDPKTLTSEQREEVHKRVFRLFSKPSDDPATPPPHSTGAVVDITLEDEKGVEVDMGGEVDENSDRSNSDHYADAQDEAGRRAQANRELLKNVMEAEGFCRLRSEWWHFSRNDQYAAWRAREAGTNPRAVALYGRADLV